MSLMILLWLDWSNEWASGRKTTEVKCVIPSHRIKGPYYDHDLSLTMLTLVIAPKIVSEVTNYLELFYIGNLLILPYLYVYSSIYLSQFKCMDIYVTL